MKTFRALNDLVMYDEDGNSIGLIHEDDELKGWYDLELVLVIVPGYEEYDAFVFNTEDFEEV